MAFPSRGNVAIRPEEPRDRRAIFELNASAFPQPAEAKLVDALRAANAATISLVAEREGRVVGHILFSPVCVEGGRRDGRPTRSEPQASEVHRVGEGSSFVAQGLAPMAVDPDCQRDGIGSALVRAGLDACRRDRHPIVFVLGHADYYPRFGFELAASRGLQYEGGTGFAPVFFVAELEEGALAGRTGVVHYHAAFAEL
jgi:putative acetyltransferase